MTNVVEKDLSKDKKRLDNGEKSRSSSRSASKKSKLNSLSGKKLSRNDLEIISFDSSLDLKYSARSSNNSS